MLTVSCTSIKDSPDYLVAIHLNFMDKDFMAVNCFSNEHAMNHFIQSKFAYFISVGLQAFINQRHYFYHYKSTYQDHQVIAKVDILHSYFTNKRIISYEEIIHVLNHNKEFIFSILPGEKSNLYKWNLEIRRLYNFVDSLEKPITKEDFNHETTLS